MSQQRILGEVTEERAAADTNAGNDIDGIKIFAMNDCDWVAARTVDEAISFYLHLNGENELEAKELSGSELDEHSYFQEHEEKRTHTTFRNQLRKMVAAGQSFPAFFASTEY